MMKKVFLSLLLLCMLGWSWREKGASLLSDEPYMNDLRHRYGSGDVSLWPEPTIDSSVWATFKEIGPLPAMEYPADNPYSDAKKELGRTLFFDPRLSRSGQIACASCHDPELAWGDGRSTSNGHNRQKGRRNALTLFNIGYFSSFFWDTRAATLEEQVSFPLLAHDEMHSTPQIAVRAIAKIKGYQPLFRAAFGSEEVTYLRIVQAIATFERSIVSPPNRFDRFVRGEKVLYTDEELLGLHLFRTKARCINCHHGPLFSNGTLHNVGLSFYGRPFEDLGRYYITQRAADVGKFRTPTLREVSRTAPYMHNGLVPDLFGVMQMYNVGMPRPKPRPEQEQDSLFPTTDPLLQRIALTQEELKAIESFLKTLSSSPNLREKEPTLPQ